MIAAFFFKTNEEKVLRVGIFAGSNWNVPQGETYAIIDEVIQKFEIEYPNVKVEYVSGIKIMPNGWQNNLLMAMSLMYFSCYLKILIYMFRWVHLWIYPV